MAFKVLKRFYDMPEITYIDVGCIIPVALFKFSPLPLVVRFLSIWPQSFEKVANTALFARLFNDVKKRQFLDIFF